MYQIMKATAGLSGLVTASLTVLCISLLSCSNQQGLFTSSSEDARKAVIGPKVTTEQVKHDSDDPAVWINHRNPTGSLIIGTDKDNADGAVYVFDLKGKIIKEKVAHGLKRPNNVDVEYGLLLQGKPTDIAVVTERGAEKIRVFSLPDMKAVDGGGIPVFVGEKEKAWRAPMGIALYKRPSDGRIYALVSRKSGPEEGYLWQYLLKDNGQGRVTADLIRKFGGFSGKGEIEAIAVDDSLGYVYYADENTGIRKYYAEPEKGDQELALFGTDHFTGDREGIAIYRLDERKGYILVSDQQANRFNVYPREGTGNMPHSHPLLTVIALSAIESDGSDVTSSVLTDAFPGGLFVAMSNDKTFQYYAWKDIAGRELKVREKQPAPQN